ncbi:MAG: hypothetical protein A2X93_02110 [Deltaproteobacteria bacterium GWC2_56_8]|nr:MAG: hypothetical protein A2X99_06830 [Deltaproteobacteria bacterium GWB2_55_19]OGP33483.1 MAG: hypothetical protein A2X93_02110 [Deltaproteobacteria bacterium GWC2_56_8]HAO94120.1 hypothetical protein [Deltaproteobacteria bacterium]
MKRLLLSAVVVCLCAAAQSAYGAASDYDPATGEPKCMDCHTPDRRYSTDYTRDETCAGCHGPGLSDNYVEIDGRFRDPSERNEIDRYAETLAVASGKGAVKGAAPKGMVLIPAGEFTMGSNEWWPKSQPEHSRMVGAFYIDRYEVTNQRYKAFVDAAGYPAPDHWKDGNIPEGKKDHPVVYVTWKDADNFCRWEGKRLPSEEEWEKAARGSDKRTFPWGDKFAKEKGNTPQYGHEDTLPIGSFESGKSPYGLYDMAGNAFEWTDSWFKPYPGNTHPDENYGEKYKVLKGGSWYDCTTYKCGISSPNYNRIFFHPTTKNNNFGFRCANDKK